MSFEIPIPDYWQTLPFGPVCFEGEGLHKCCLDVASEAVLVALIVIYKTINSTKQGLSETK